MKRTLVVLAVLCGLMIGVGFGFVLGFKKGSFQVALQENKIATVNLKFNSTNITPQLREYLKARVYYNVHRYYPSKKGYLNQVDWDYGRVDREVLRNIAVFKDPDWTAWDWPTAISAK